MLCGFSVAEGPEGVTVAARITLPEKPLTLCRVRLYVEEAPWLMLSEAWLDVIVTSAPT